MQSDNDHWNDDGYREVEQHIGAEVRFSKGAIYLILALIGWTLGG